MDSGGSQLPPGSHPSHLSPPEPQPRGPITDEPKDPGRSPTQSKRAFTKDLRLFQPQGWPARGSRLSKRTGSITRNVVTEVPPPRRLGPVCIKPSIPNTPKNKTF